MPHISTIAVKLMTSFTWTVTSAGIAADRGSAG
jgi:hypothetical protein